MPDHRTRATTAKPGASTWYELATLPEPVITYADPHSDDELAGAAVGASCAYSATSRTPKKTCPLPLRGSRRKSFTTRSRRQRRRELAEFDALPIVRRARAAGLHGAALRAYVAAVQVLDGRSALSE